MPTGFLGLGWSLAFGLAVLLCALIAGLFTARRRPKLFAFARSLPLVPDGPAPAGGPFIGREQELDDFRRYIKDEGARPHGRPGGPRWSGGHDSNDSRPPVLLLVSGEAGVGKRALLKRFESLCVAERRPPRCGPVIDLREPRRVVDVLAETVEQLTRGQRDQFERFERALERYQRVSQGQRTRGQEGLDLTRDVVSVAMSVVPGGARTAGALGSAGAERVVERWEGGSDLNAVGEAFAQDLVEFAENDPRNRVVLLFADLDSRPGDRDIIWLRNWLFPKIALGRAVLIVASVTSEDSDAPGISGIERLGEPTRMRLERFADDEARRFVTEVIGVPADSSLADTIVARSGGILDRLQGYRRLIERNPGIRETGQFPEDADAWASGGLTYSLLHELSSKLLEQVVVATSPLRWLNASLLDQVSIEAKIERGEEEKVARASDLIRWGTRPSWIVSRGGGWAIEDDEHRRTLVAEFRRLDPMLYRAVHRLAAHYHHDRLIGEQLAEDESIHEIFDELETPSEGYEDGEYVATLSEWLYHLLALDPERAFPLVVRKGVEALFARPEAADQIVAIDVELNLAPRQRLYLDLLARSATALKTAQQAESIRVLDQLRGSGEPIPLVKPVVLHLLGQQYWNVGDIGRATRRFESAHDLFSREPLDRDPAAIRMRCENATWLAYGLANRDGVERRALQHLAEASTLAESLNDPSLIAELARVRGLVQRQAGDALGARESCDAALAGFQAAGKPDQVALVRRDRATLFLDEEQYDEADHQLEVASGLYSFLADFKSWAEVEVARAEVALFRGDEDKAKEHVTEARRRRPGDAELENQIGNAYFRTAFFGGSRHRYERAIEYYREALKTAADVGVYQRNLANALLQIGEREEANKIFEELLQVDPQDELTMLLYAFSKRETGERRDAEAADALFNRVKNQRLRDLDADPPRAGAYWAVGDLLYDWAGILSGPEATKAFREAEAAFAKACELDPEEPGYAFRRGQALYALGQAEAAVTVLRDAAERAPGREAVRAELAKAMTSLAPDRSLPELRSIRERFPDDANLLGAYAQIVSSLDFDRGIAEVEHQLDRFPNEPELHFLRARLLRASPRTPEAESDRFESAPPTRSLGGATGATVRGLKNGSASHESDILDALRRACELGEKKRAPSAQVKYLLELADFQIEHRNWAEAKSSALKAQDLDSSSERVEESLRRIRFGDSWARKVESFYPGVTPLEVEVSGDLLSWVEPPDADRLYNEMFPAMRQRLTERWGIQFPNVRVRADHDLDDRTVIVYLREIPRYSFTVFPLYLAGASPEQLGAIANEAVDAVRPWDGGSGAWVSHEEATAIGDEGIPIWDPRGVIVATVAVILERHAAEFVTTGEVALLARGVAADLEERLPLLVTLMRRLIAEGVPATQFEVVADEFRRSAGKENLGAIQKKIRGRLRSHAAAVAK